MNTILLTGASGYIGKALLPCLKQAGYAVRILTTQKVDHDITDVFHWDPLRGIFDDRAVIGVDYIIHLAGASVGTHPWTKKRRKLIMESRIKSTTLLYQKITRLSIPLKAFISASAVGYYGSSLSEKVMDEYSPAGRDFLASVCVEWERAVDLFSLAGYRTVKIRTGLVLGADAPALQKMLIPVKLGIGGPLGSGNQQIPWIAIDDLCMIYLKAIEDNTLKGSVNAVAPQSVTNRVFMKTLAEIFNKPFFMPPVPAIILKLLLGDMAVIITGGKAVYPRRLISVGFEYKYQNLNNLFATFRNL
jgi:hypothetical protein